MGTQKYILYCATSCWSKSLRQTTFDRETVLWNIHIFSLERETYLFFLWSHCHYWSEFRVCVWEGKISLTPSFFFQRISKSLMLVPCLFQIFTIPPPSTSLHRFSVPPDPCILDQLTLCPLGHSAFVSE